MLKTPAWLKTAVCFVAALVVLGWNIDAAGIAIPYSDPIAGIRAQDETIHVDASMRMAGTGDWLTPKILDRFFLFKPPLLIWLSAFSIKMLGLSLFAVRLPNVLAGAAGVAALFAWSARSRSLCAGALAAALLATDPLWNIFSRLCYTDVLASGFGCLAVAAVALDPQMLRTRTPVAVGLLGGAAILAKSVAGFLPFLAVVLYWVVLKPAVRPALHRVVLACLLAAIVVAPWILYQSAVHPQWFYADFVQVQLLGIGLRGQPRASIFDIPILYYVRRLFEMDPLLVFAAVQSLGPAVRAFRAREDAPVILATCWTLVTVAALCAFQAKNLPYVVFLAPPLAITAALCAPAFADRSRWATLGFIAAVIVVKAAGAGQPWSLRPPAPPRAGAVAMRQYAEMGRDTELVSVNPDDEFYSSTLRLPHIRYAFLDPGGNIAAFAPHYLTLGIAVTTAQFSTLPSLLPHYREVLERWGIRSDKPVANAIIMKTPEEFGAIYRAAPSSDFYIPADYRAFVPAIEDTHTVQQSSENRLLLLARNTPRRREIPPLPARW